MRCQKCGADNLDNASYCSACGYQLVIGDSPAITYESYAGFWKRFGAFIIDSVVLVVITCVCAVIAVIVFGAAMFSTLFSTFLGAFLAIIAVVGYYLFAIVLGWLYFTLMESSARQATLGKMAMGIVVIDINGNRISFVRANIRYWSKILSSFIFFIGYILAAFTEKKQALHDLIANTFVIDN